MQTYYKSFGAYLEDHYYNEMFQAIKNFLYRKGRTLDLKSYVVVDPSYIQLDDIHVRGVSFQGNEGRQIVFNVTVEADVILKGMGQSDYDADVNSIWLTVSFYGQLIAGLREVRVVDVSEYSKERFCKESTLSKYLVPYIYSDDLDKEAEKFLHKYYPQALKYPMPLDMEELVDNMCLEMYYAPLPDHIFGMSYFGQATVEVFEEGNRQIRKEEIDVGTILVNPDVYFMRNVGSINNTIVHECIHHDLHSNFFELQKLLNSKVGAISCEAVEEYGDVADELDKALHWMEWQANAIAPRILMPLNMTRQKLKEILQRIYDEKSSLRDAEIMQLAIEELATFFNVSRLAAKIRAIDAGFYHAAGTFVYVDGRYYPPYTFRSETIGKNQTFVVDEMNALYEASISEDISKLLYSGKIVYANAMFCINDPKYVFLNEDNSFGLTDYALEHVDECCLAFERKNRVSQMYDDSFYRRCFLCRDVNSSNFVEAHYNPNYEDNQCVKERAEEMAIIRDSTKKISDELMNMPGSFSKTLEYHMKRKGLTNEMIAERSGLSSRIISDYRNNESLTKELPTVMALCIGLNLHPFYAEDLIEKAGHVWKRTQEHMVFKWLIFSHSDENIYQWNRRLEDAGISQRLPSNKHIAV